MFQSVYPLPLLFTSLAKCILFAPPEISHSEWALFNLTKQHDHLKVSWWMVLSGCQWDILRGIPGASGDDTVAPRSIKRSRGDAGKRFFLFIYNDDDNIDRFFGKSSWNVQKVSFQNRNVISMTSFVKESWQTPKRPSIKYQGGENKSSFYGVRINWHIFRQL